MWCLDTLAPGVFHVVDFQCSFWCASQDFGKPKNLGGCFYHLRSFWEIFGCRLIWLNCLSHRCGICFLGVEKIISVFFWFKQKCWWAQPKFCNVSRKNTSRNLIGLVRFSVDMSPAACWQVTLNFALLVATKILCFVVFNLSQDSHVVTPKCGILKSMVWCFLIKWAIRGFKNGVLKLEFSDT